MSVYDKLRSSNGNTKVFPVTHWHWICCRCDTHDNDFGLERPQVGNVLTCESCNKQSEVVHVEEFTNKPRENREPQGEFWHINAGSPDEDPEVRVIRGLVALMKMSEDLLNEDQLGRISNWFKDRYYYE